MSEGNRQGWLRRGKTPARKKVLQFKRLPMKSHHLPELAGAE
ncbi:Uncharacterised protein [Pseudomonas aeruginosa]|uniref:Uncharacterized protein n=1 Tax=Pseudomonas paraeruginosa TaxID=2994495 RepID=A0A2R3ILU6_9PSED|nr:hypothetical protein CSB93_3949 [Pseudomonas paraeruginosa]AWE92295.1 hypothetical protein CSC28_2731 [Pseudomonas paraeruginosa]VCY56505.1 hypothetical protein BANRA_02375 [Pseudomonas aeruginosa]VFT60846.1 Uncharacterised protein [Pseudomonas aeruginosa]VTM11115.1 Uncharacterised protein [Pseudomonas aeruginosa]